MSKLILAYFTLLKFIIVACLAAMVVMVFSNVVMRYAFNTGLPVSEELARWCFVWLTFLGSILVLHDRSHLGVDLVIQALNPSMRKLCLIVASALMIYATWLILVGSVEQTILNMGASAPATGLSQGWFFGVGVVFALSTGIILIYQLIVLLKTPASELDAVITNHSSGAE
ncbi:MAG TPA: TRAP transporter small permease [Advenella kashmirensis]|uniref:TRAP transporter small permease protein n=2 Tax=Advenella TaxID=290425 RepID=A0A356LCJ4_9BURK|nr:TRAP transporter small permease [Advenella kashmirensis]